MTHDDGVTPDVTFLYDRLGRQTNVTDGTGTHEFNYAPDGDNLLEDGVRAGNFYGQYIAETVPLKYQME